MIANATFPSDPQSVKVWLQSVGLDQYYDQFQASGFTNLAQCSNLSLQSLHALHVNLHGNKKRLFREAQGLLGSLKVMAEGAWEEHAQLSGGS